jgi:hypothetical protein
MWEWNQFSSTGRLSGLDKGFEWPGDVEREGGAAVSVGRAVVQALRLLGQRFWHRASPGSMARDSRSGLGALAEW